MRCGAERGAVIHTRQPEAVDAACRVDLVHEERLTRGLERLDLCHVAGAADVTRGGCGRCATWRAPGIRRRGRGAVRRWRRARGRRRSSTGSRRTRRTLAPTCRADRPAVWRREARAPSEAGEGARGGWDWVTCGAVGGRVEAADGQIGRRRAGPCVRGRGHPHLAASPRSIWVEHRSEDG